jgi:hypothetical protein
VETEGPTTEHGGEEPGTNNNVVPFPRDWLGPREELIPFGSNSGYGAEQSAAAPGAEAFWGGDSGPLHAVLPEPVAAGGAAGARVRMRAGRLAVAGLAAAVLAAAVFGRLAGLPAGSNPSVGSGVAAAGFFDLALLRGAVGAPAIESPKPAVHRSPAVHPHPTAHVRRSAAGSRTSGSGSTAAASSASSATTAAARPATSASQTVSSTGSSSSASEPAATSSAPTHSSVSSHTATVRPGPVGPGAPFGPGQLK